MKKSSVSALFPKTSSHVPVVLLPSASHTARNSGRASPDAVAVSCKLFGNGPGESIIGSRRAVARIRNHSYFILDLHHDDRVRVAICFSKMPHQRCKGMGIGIAVYLTESREPLASASVSGLDARKALDVSLSPTLARNSSKCSSSFQTTKTPAAIHAAGLLEPAVHDCEVEFPLLRLNQLPRNRG